MSYGAPAALLQGLCVHGSWVHGAWVHGAWLYGGRLSRSHAPRTGLLHDRYTTFTFEEAVLVVRHVLLHPANAAALEGRGEIETLERLPVRGWKRVGRS